MWLNSETAVSLSCFGVHFSKTFVKSIMLHCMTQEPPPAKGLDMVDWALTA